MRRRGILTAEGDFRLFEAIVEQGQVYRLEQFHGTVPRISKA